MSKLLPFLSVLLFVVGCKDVRDYRIGTNSMYPTLRKGDIAIVGKGKYKYAGQVRRWDVVAFRHYEHMKNRGPWAKRVVGLPGEIIQLGRNEIFVDGRKLLLPSCLENQVFISDDYRTHFAQNSKFTIPEDSFFVLGDNCPVSADSRHYGYVRWTEIIGKVTAKKDNAGQYELLPVLSKREAE